MGAPLNAGMYYDAFYLPVLEGNEEAFLRYDWSDGIHLFPGTRTPRSIASTAS
jgi:hypothetical protein